MEILASVKARLMFITIRGSVARLARIVQQAS